MARPNHFEIPVDDPDRAEDFYRSIFGWKFDRFPGAPEYYGMATTGDENPGINGALFKRGEGSVCSLTMGVDSIEDTEAKITAKGGSVIRGKTPIPGMGYFAQYRDTEGNQFGLFVNDESATM